MNKVVMSLITNIRHHHHYTPLSMEKYTIDKMWILRKDIGYANSHIIFNPETRKLYQLTPGLYSILKLFYRNAFSFEDIASYLSNNGINISLQELCSLPEKMGLTDVLVQRDSPYHRHHEDFDTNTISSLVPVTTTPMDVELLLTHNCNLRCKHCFQMSQSNSDKRKHLSVDEWTSIFKEFERLGVLSVIITGGEPLAYEGFENLLNEIANYNIAINILTNGLLINNRNLNLFLRPNIALTISLDGCNAEEHEAIRGKGTFSKTCEIIRLLTSNGADLNIAHTINNNNKSSLEEFIQFIISLGVVNLSINFVEPEGRAAENKSLILSKEEEQNVHALIETLTEKYKNYIHIDFPSLAYKQEVQSFSNTNLIYCAAGTKRISISSDGKVYPCVYAQGIPSLEKGDLRNQPLSEIWQDNNRWLLQRGGITLDQIEKCNDCQLATQCSLRNCRIKHYNKVQGLYAKPYNCLSDKL